MRNVRSRRSRNAGSSSFLTSNFNRGVSHGIKKPKRNKKSIIKLKKQQLASKRTSSGQLKTIIQKMKDGVNGENEHFAAVVKRPQILSSSSKVNVNTTTGTVSPHVRYVLKNGQYQFLRSSPRKHVQEQSSSKDGERGQNVDCFTTPVRFRMKSKLLFTPSNEKCLEATHSPLKKGDDEKRRSARIPPSPVKFQRIPSNSNISPEADGNKDVVSAVLDGMDLMDDCPPIPPTSSQSTILVLDNEEFTKKDNRVDKFDIEKLSWSTVEQLDTLNKENETTLLRTPDSKRSTRLANKTTPSSKTTSLPLYPVFNNKVTRSPVAKSGKSSKWNITATPQSFNLDANQSVIDAGQKRIGAIECPTCLCLYTPGHKSEEDVHEKVHDEHVGNFKLYTSTSTRSNTNALSTSSSLDSMVVLRDDVDDAWKIVKVDGSSPKRIQCKALAIVRFVNKVLGVHVTPSSTITTDGSFHWGSESPFTVYLGVSNSGDLGQRGSVVGCLVSERLSTVLEDCQLSTSFVSKDNLRVAQPIDRVSGQNVVGVSRIWVSPGFRRQGFASKLVDSLRFTHFSFCSVLSKTELAFSHTTLEGSKFASRYVGSDQFMVYVSPNLSM